MIAYLKGRVLAKTSKEIILKSGEIGYHVFLLPTILAEIQVEQDLEFFIYSYIKEDALDLYGFKTLDELEFFKQLISVSGVGPKSAINVLGLAPMNQLKKAITSGDPTILQQVSGIGKKTAERLVVELKEKIITDLSDQDFSNNEDVQVKEALVSLGYREQEARAAIKDLKLEGDLAAKVKAALQAITNK